MNHPALRLSRVVSDPTTICFPFAGDLVGGSHLSALGLISALDRSRFRPLVLVDKAGGHLAELFRDAGIEVERAPQPVELRHGKHISPGEAWRLSRTYPAISAYLRLRGIRIVHTNDGRTHAAWAVPARMAGAKLVWHHRSNPRAWGRRLVAPLLAHQVITVSHYADGSGPLRPAGQVIHSPFDVERRHDRAAARQSVMDELKLAPAARLVGFFGALIARKRPLMFVAAIAALRQKRPDLDVHGLVFGEALDVSLDDLRKAAERQGVADAIHLMGFRKPGAFWIAACDALLVPAIEEPFGRTLIEAMLAETPIVATDSGGNPEAVQDGKLGVLVPPEDPLRMAQALIGLFDDPTQCRTMIERARAHAAHRFGLRSHAEQVMAIYDRLLAERRGWYAERAAGR